MGENLYEFNDVPENYDDFFDNSLTYKVVAFNINDLFVLEKLFINPIINAYYNTHISFIENYLPGNDNLISNTDARLAEKAITDNGKIKVNQNDTIDFILNGHNVIAEIPKEWRDTYYKYSKDLELAIKKYKSLLSEGKTKKYAYENSILLVETKPIDTIWIDDYIGLDPSYGGIHSRFKNHDEYKPKNSNIIRATNVKHFDISGAYGTLAKIKNLLGEAQERYNLFMDNKFKFKSANSSFYKNKHLSVNEIKNGLKEHFNLNINSNDILEIQNELKFNVESSKLGTNAPIGKVDEYKSYIYNPLGIKEIRMILQPLFYYLSKDLTDIGAIIFSINTDGLFLVNGLATDEQIFNVVKNWETKWGLKLDYDVIDKYISKSDNDRILITKNGVEYSGDDLIHQSFIPQKMGKKPKIVDVCLAEKIIDPSLSIKDIVMDKYLKNRVDLFGWTIKPTKLHKFVVNNKISQDINRVFLTTTGDTIGNYSILKDKVESFNNFPENAKVLIFNGKTNNFKLPTNLDIDLYVKMIEDVYNNRWI